MKTRILIGLEATEGGSLKHVVYLASNLDKNQFELTVILSNSRGNNLTGEIKKLRDQGVHVHLIHMSKQIKPWKDLKAIRDVYYHIKAHKYDVVHAHSSKAGAVFRIAAWLAKSPKILYTPHCFYFQSSSRVRKLFILIERCLARITHKIIVSYNERSWALKEKTCPPQKLININNSINFDDYKFLVDVQKSKTKWGLNNRYVVGAVGRLATQKNWEMLIEASQHVIKIRPEVVFIIAGDGELRDQLFLKIVELNLCEHFKLLGHVERIEEVYAVCNLIVSTSLWEGLPYSYLEAMHFAKPIVATDLGHEDLFIDGDTALLVEQQSAKMLSTKITRLIDDKALATKIGRGAKHKISSNQYSFEHFITQHEMCYLSGDESG
ncbi:MAG: glycosyltransferase [Cytophagales bacterium]|nr:glycosyltransferase [Cytophagales bacterium]